MQNSTPKKPKPIWHVLGVGAMGSLWASQLHATEKKVHLILSPRRQAALAANETTLQLSYEFNNTISIYEIPIHPASHKTSQTITNLIIATKSNDLMTALRSIHSSIKPGARIVVLCNGMGFHDSISELLPQCTVFAAVSTDGAWLRSRNHVVHAGKGQTKLGLVSYPITNSEQLKSKSHKAEILKQLRNDLRCRGLSLVTRLDTERMLLAKLCVNAAINGLTAIHACPNGDLLRLPKAKLELDQLINELEQFLLVIKQTRLAHTIRSQIVDVLNRTSNNFSSTYTDIKQGRRTELASVNGHLLKMANSLNIALPNHQHLVNRINALQK